jgi:esterase/lipase superfamily enzyme
MGVERCRGDNRAWTLRAVISLLLAASLATAALGVAVRAQGSDGPEGLNRQIEELYSEGKYAEAVPLAERYVDLARKRYGEEHLEFATAITWLGSLYQSQDRFVEVEPLFKRALLIREKALGPDNAQVGVSLSNLAALYEQQSRKADAEPLLKRALSIREKALGADELDAMPRQIQELGWSRRDAEALRLAERYVELARERYGAEQPEFVLALNTLASLHVTQSRYAEAEPLYKQALSIREKALGLDHLQVADSLEALAGLYQIQGRYAEAEPLLKRALSIRETALGPDDLQVADSLEALAGLYEAQGRIAETEPLRSRVQAIQKKRPRYHYAIAPETSYAVVKVYYGTDRKKTSDIDPAKTYGGDRGELALGICTVSIPRDHRMGELEAPSVWRLEWSDDPERHVVLLSVTEKDRTAFYQDVADRVRASAGKSAFVFVHGYNVTFADAARRTAQMAYDLGFDGAPVFYSWPSQARYASYKVDETNAEWSQFDFKTFLRDFAEQSGAESIFLIAHSMGSRVLTGALKELVLEDPAIRSKFKEIILAAPDIDADTFRRDIAPKILSKNRSATLYASSGDYALMASKTFAGYRRAGDSAGGVTVAQGLDTIDASSIRTDFVGHSYYGDSGSVLGDMRNLMLLRKRAEERPGLAPVQSAAGRYWAFSH